MIDPRKTPLASEVDLWLRIRPRTDAALALAVIRTIIEEDLYDKYFMAEWCVWFDEAKTRVAAFTPEKV